MNAGELLLGSGLVAAIASAALHLGALRGRRSRAGSWAFAIHALLTVGALALLAFCFLSRRFEYAYVAQYSSRSLSGVLTLAAVWAGQEGSILLWAAFGALVGLALLRQPGTLARPALFFVSLAQVSLFALLAVRSPFATTASVPPDGQGLNPLLQDPWMVIHPPVLFLGYAALLVPYALAAAALARGEYREWNRMAWPWALFAVVTLGAGISLGGVWAYKVLGWGGYWGWDPVENASLIPWLVAVALLHGLLIQRTTGALVRTNLALAFAGWATVLGGTYLTRSGVLQDFSVHSFAESGLNAPLTATLALFVLLAAALLAARWRRVDAGSTAIANLSRESALWLGMITVLALATLVALGTSAPLLTSLVGKPAGVQPAFYGRVSLPVGIALVLLMGVSPALRWFRQSGASWLAGLTPGLAGVLLVTAPAAAAGVHDPGFLALIVVAGFALGVNVAVAARLFGRGWMYGAGYLGHAGLAVMVLGLALSTSLGRSERLELRRGRTVESLGYALTWEGEERTPQGGRVLRIAVEAKGWRLDARPELLPSPRDQGVMRKPAISGARELYLSPLEVREPEPGMDADGVRVALSLPNASALAGVAVVDLSTKPFINLVWIGVLLAFIGTGLAGLRRAAEPLPSRRDRPIASGPQPARRHTQTPRGKEPVMQSASSNPSARGRGQGLLIALIALGAGLASAPVALSAEPAAAPPDTAKPVMFLKETLVTGSRYPRAYYESPQALSFVTRSQMLDLHPTVVGDVLGGLPGVDNSKDSPWEQRPNVRGMSGQRVLVLMDGSPMNSARGNGPHPSLVDPGQVERIEVVRGPSSVAYGSDALGGVINIITRQAPLSALDRSLTGSASVGGSTVDQQGTGYLELIPRIGRLSAFLSSGARKAENFETPSGSVPNSQFKDYNALLNLRYDLTDRTALKSGYQVYRGTDIGIPGLDIRIPGETDAFSFPFYERDFVHLTLDQGYRDSWLAGTRVKGYWQREHRSFFSENSVTRPNFYSDPYLGLPPGSAPPTAQSVYQRQDRYFDLDTWGAQLQATSVQTRSYRLTTGIDAARDITDGDNVRFRTYSDAAGNPIPGPGGSNPTSVRVTASVPDGRFDNYGGYAQSEWYLDRLWTLSAGGRYTHYRYRTDYGLSSPAAGPSPPVYFQPKSVDDDALSGSAGLVYAPIADLHLTANVANGYREPNAQDLFFNGPGSVGFVLGNENLKPEKSISYDFGARWGPGAFAVSGNAFYTTFEDLISAVPVVSGTIINGVPASPGTYQYTNIATANTWGGELEAQWRFRPQWLARTAMSGTVGTVTSREAIRQIYQIDGDEVPLEQVPPYRGNASLRWTQASGRYWVESTARWSWRTNRLPPPINGVIQLSTFKSEWLAGDLFAGAKLGGQRVLIGVRNFTDTPYRQALGSIEEPGISLVGSISTDF